MMAAVRASTLEVDIGLRLGAFTLQARFDAKGEIVTLFGHSGSGKSLTLRAIAGLQRPQTGRISIGGLVAFDASRSIDVPPHRRPIGYMVQDPGLFPHLSVEANVRFGAAGSRQAQRRRARELLALLGLEGFEGRMPRTLSGGQQQRVALARALARDARVLLLDEPFSALDESLRSALRRELLRLRGELGLTIVFVTHDLREAHLLADKLAIFDQGRILQLGPREDVFRRPASRRVAELTGVANVFRGQVVASEGGGCLVSVDGLVVRCVGNGTPCPTGSQVDVAIRAERVNLRRATAGAISNAFPARIVEEFAYGSSHTLHLVPEGAGPPVEVEIASRPYDVLDIASQKRWLVELPPEDLHVMPAIFVS